MTREEARKAAEVMLAYADGKEIEWSHRGEEKWLEVGGPDFNWDHLKYRIKPNEEVEKEGYSFQPFDRVLVRGAASNKWMCAIFSHIEIDLPRNMYVANSLYWNECLPYNEKTAHLVGTPIDYMED